MADRRPDRRQVLRALLLAAAGLAVPTACGVPSGGGPIVDGPGPSYDPSTGARGQPPVPGDASSATELVQLFLYAISGPLNTSDALNTARSRARQFLIGKAYTTWKPPEVVTVVRLEDLTSSISGSDTIVSGTLETVGTLKPDRGLVDPSAAVARVPVKFTVSQGTGSVGMLISELPAALQSVLPLGTDALDNRYYTPQLLYFWDNRQRFLVPELRYVPSTGLTDNVRLTTIVRWLLAGPSDLLGSVATSIFPPGTDLSVANLTNQGGRLVVPFSSELQGLKTGDLGKVLAQLRWSLQPLYKLDAPLELQIANQPQTVTPVETSLYLSANPADETTGRTADAQPFCVVGGAVTALDGALPAIVAKPEYNRDVLQAALSRDRRSAVLLTTAKRLTIGRIDDTGTITYRPVELAGQSWSRPTWLLSHRLLVAVDGALVWVGPTGLVSAPLLTGGTVTAFSVAPDGYRIALIINNALAVATLRDDGDQLTIGTPHTVDTGLKDLNGVAWSRLERVVVAGRVANQWRLAEVGIDGALRTVWNTNFANPIVSVVAYPRLPSDTPGPGQIMVQTQENAVFRVFVGTASATYQPLSVKPSPEPSPSGATNTARPLLTAPFYPD
jgi:Lipoprotein LpqB beta-propeller domain